MTTQHNKKPFLTLAKEELMVAIDDQLPADQFPEEFRTHVKRELWVGTIEALLKQSYANGQARRNASR